MQIKSREGITAKIASQCGELNITLNRGKLGDIIECFIRAGKAGSCFYACNEALGRLISLHLRKNGNIDDVIRELSDTQCNQEFIHNGVKYSSCIDAISQMIKMEVNNGNKKDE